MPLDGRSDRAPGIGVSAVALMKTDGAALVATLMGMTLMTVLASTLILETMSEAVVAASYRDGLVARYIAEGAAERAIARASAAADWSLLAARSTQWAFAEGSGSAVVRCTAATGDPTVETLELTTQASGPGAIARSLLIVIERRKPPGSREIRLVSWQESP